MMATPPMYTHSRSMRSDSHPPPILPAMLASPTALTTDAATIAANPWSTR
jgi:hypothetical protein